MFDKIVEGLIDVIYPSGPFCDFCGAPLNLWEICWCDTCGKKLKKLKYRQCKRCAKYLSYSSLCSDCQNEIYPFSLARSAGIYEGILKQALQNFKYRGKRLLAVSLGRLAALEAIKHDDFLNTDFVIPVPLTERKRSMRGYNQAALMGQEIARHLGIPFQSGILIKKRDTADMVGLSREQRKINLKNAFAVTDSKKIKAQRILLVDDIFTTGNTVASCSETLLKAGAKEVFVITAAASFDI